MDVQTALADASTVPFWLDTDERPTPLPPLTEDLDAELLIVGGGFTGLWTALQAKERDPDRHVVLVEANTTGWAASGRNGGFCAASLTHGYDNGQAHLPRRTSAWRPWAGRTSTPSRPPWPGTAWTASSNAPVSSMWPPRTTRSPSCGRLTIRIPVSSSLTSSSWQRW